MQENLYCSETPLLEKAKDALVSSALSDDEKSSFLNKLKGVEVKKNAHPKTLNFHTEMYLYLWSITDGSISDYKDTNEKTIIEDQIDYNTLLNTIFLLSNGLSIRNLLKNRVFLNIDFNDLVDKINILKEYNLDIPSILVFNKEILSTENEVVKRIIVKEREKEKTPEQFEKLYSRHLKNLDKRNDKYDPNDRSCQYTVEILNHEDEKFLLEYLYHINRSFISKEELNEKKGFIYSLLFDSVLPLCTKIVNEQLVLRLLSNNNQDFEDLIGEARLGVYIAIEDFDQTKTCKFATYCYKWIERFVQRGINGIIAKKGGEITLTELLIDDDEDFALKIQELIDPDSEKEFQIVELSNALESIMNILSNNEKSYLEYFLQGKESKEISDCMGFSISYLTQLRNTIIEKIRSSITIQVSN